MCHPDDQEYMLIDKTWGIMPPSSRCPFGLNFVSYYLCHVGLTVPFFVARDHLEVTLEQWSFLEKIFKIKLAERTWAKLVTLGTIHRYYDGVEPTVAARRYDSQARRHKSIAF